jgi:hypothetical protein
MREQRERRLEGEVEYQARVDSNSKVNIIEDLMMPVHTVARYISGEEHTFRGLVYDRTIHTNHHLLPLIAVCLFIIHYLKIL